MKKYFYLVILVLFVFSSFFFINIAKATTENITQINFTTLPQTVDVNVASPVLITQTQNVSNLSEAVSETTTLIYNSTSATGQFSDANISAGTCDESSWSNNLTLTLASTRSNKGFCYKDSNSGTHTLTVSAQGKSWTPATQTITVTLPITADTTPPTLYLPTNITEEVASPDGVIVNYTVTADDTDPIHPEVICVPASGTIFPIGTTVVNCSATDTALNIATGSFEVIVKDITPPIAPPIVKRKQGSYRVVLPNVLNAPNAELIKKILDSENEKVLGVEKYNFSQDLFFGSRGQEVKELQKFLISKGLLKQGAFGGFFGIFTETALKEYQKANNLWADGIVGPQTRAMLNR